MIKVNKETEESVCENYNCGMKMKEIAEANKIDYSSVWRILKRNSVETGLRKTGPLPVYKINENYFSKIDSEEKAYWLGFIAADGCVQKLNGGNHSFSLHLSTTDIEHLKLFRDAINSNHKITFSTQKAKNTENLYHSCCLNIVRSTFVRNLINYGIVPRKTKVLKFPQLQPCLERHFIRGYFDGDGCWHIRNRGKVQQMAFSIRCASIEFLEVLRNIVVNKCDLKRNKITSNNNCYRLIYEGNNVCLKIYNFLYENSTVNLCRKYNKAKEHLDKMSGLSTIDPDDFYKNLARVAKECNYV